MDKPQPTSRHGARAPAVWLQESFFAANVAAAIVYAILFDASKNQASENARDDSTYYFLRGAYRLLDFLHIDTVKPVSTSTVARDFPKHLHLGGELLVIITTAALATLVLGTLRLLRPYRAHPMLLNKAFGATALLVMPALYLVVLRRTWSWPTPSSGNTGVFIRNSVVVALFVELVCAAVFWALGRRRSFSGPIMAAFLVLHYTLWILCLQPTSIGVFAYQLDSAYLLVLVPAVVGTLWSLYFSRPREIGPSEPVGGSYLFSTLALVAAAAILWAIWAPRSAAQLFPPKNPTTIRLSRGPCFGRCPVYLLTLHEDGSVEYVGYKYVRIHGPRQANILPEQFAKILQILDAESFSQLDDRAFSWCFDTGSVAVSVVLATRTIGAVSDDWCMGKKTTGVQARFVAAAKNIDGIVGSNQWVECDGPCGN